MVDEPTTPEVEDEDPLTGDSTVTCPTCERWTRLFLIIDDKCDQCRAEEVRVTTPFTLGWEEVRQRRNMMMIPTDKFVLPDQNQERIDAYVPVRTRMRDVTNDFATPEEAWAELDEIEAELAQITV